MQTVKDSYSLAKQAAIMMNYMEIVDSNSCTDKAYQMHR